jgi:hypothetical protein
LQYSDARNAPLCGEQGYVVEHKYVGDCLTIYAFRLLCHLKAIQPRVAILTRHQAVFVSAIVLICLAFAIFAPEDRPNCEEASAVEVLFGACLK